MSAPLLLPAYKALENDKRYTLVEGGRGSAKSFHVSIWALTQTYRPNEVILYTRYTMDSAEKSIIPEFREKIDLYGLAHVFSITKKEIINTLTGSRIMFSGIKTSSGNQTAKLKSITGLSCWILDEAEEMPSITDFNKIDESIRVKGGLNKVLIVLNPAFKSHWIYKHFHLSGKREDTQYIHTTYRGNKANLDESFICKAEALKQEDYPEYAHRYLGHWQDIHKGIIFQDYEIVDSMPPGPYLYGLDWGYVDPQALVRVRIVGKELYVQELSYKSWQTVEQLIQSLPALGVEKSDKIYYDAAGAGNGEMLYNAGYRSAKPAKKGAGSIGAGIVKIKEYSLKVVKPSENLLEELLNYAWDTDKAGELVEGKPIDAFNHALDSLRYAIFTYAVGPKGQYSAKSTYNRRAHKR